MTIHVRRHVAWALGTAVIVVFPLGFAIGEDGPALRIGVVCAAIVGVILGASIHAGTTPVTARIRRLPPPVLLAVGYPVAVWIAVTIDYYGHVDPEPTPQLVWTVGTLLLVWIAIVGATLPSGRRWFGFFRVVFWVCGALTLVFWGLGLMFLPLALAYGAAARQRRTREGDVSARPDARSSTPWRSRRASATSSDER